MMKLIKDFRLEIAIFFVYVLLHAFGMGVDNFNTDVWKWKARSYNFSSGIFTLKPELTLQKYHPGVTLMWAGTFGIKVTNAISKLYLHPNEIQQVFLLDFWQKFFLMLFIGTTLVSIFYLIRKIIDTRFALLAIILLIFEPFYLGLTRVFHLEGLLSTFMLASVLWFYYYLNHSKKNGHLFVSSFFGSLAVLTKTSAVFVILFIGLMLLIDLATSKNFANNAKRMVFWILGFIITGIIFWPAIWAIPQQTFSELLRGVFEVGVDTDHIQYYFGQLTGNPGISFYFVVLAFKSSVLLIPGLLGLLFIFKKLPENHRKLITTLAIYSAFYLLQITIPSKKLDRYLLPAIMSLSLMSSFFYYYLLNFSKFALKTSRLLYTILGFLILIPAIYLFPDYFSYYNPLFGGINTGIKVLEPKWMIGAPQIISYFDYIQKKNNFEQSDATDSFEEIIYKNPVKNVLSVGFQEKYYTQIWPFFRLKNSWAVIQDLTPFAVHTKYFVYPVWDDSGANENRFAIKYIDTIKIRGTPVYKVYERLN